MDQGISRSAGAAVILAVLGASGVAAAGVRTEGMYVWTSSSIFRSDGFDYESIMATGLASSSGAVAVNRGSIGLGSSFAEFRFDVPDADQPAGRIRFDGSIEAENRKVLGSVGSHTTLSWFFRTSEPTVLELRGLYQWQGDALTQNQMDIGLFGESDTGFRLITSDRTREISARISLPAGYWGLHVFRGLSGEVQNDGGTFAARSSLELDFRIVPAPATLTAFVGVGLMASRRRR